MLGLAPAANGGNRTGRIFTGDSSGDFLWAALHRAGLANQPTSVRADDGLRAIGCWVTAAVKCAPPGNKPLPSERGNCAPYLVRELAALGHVRVVLALGAFAWDAALSTFAAMGEATPGPGRASATARRRGSVAGPSSAATTRASRTRSPASSPSR